MNTKPKAFPKEYAPNPFIKLAIVAVITAIVGVVLWQVTEPPKRTMNADSDVLVDEKIIIGGDVDLIDTDGKPFTLASLPSDFYLVYFGFTFCPDVCPTELQNIANSLKIVSSEAMARLQPLFITIDPVRDTPEVLKDYVSLFHQKLVGLTGTETQIAATAKTFRVYYAKAGNPNAPENSKDDSFYMMDHSSFVYLTDNKGVVLEAFSYATPPKDMAAKIDSVIAKNTSP